MLRVCTTCHCVQQKTSSGKCNQPGCKGALAKAWKCNSCDTVQESTTFNSCRTKGCKGKLEKLKDATAPGSMPPRPVMPTSHVYMGTASQASRLVVEKEEPKDKEQVAFRGELNALLAQGPRVRQAAPTLPAHQPTEAPKVVRSDIPARTIARRNPQQDAETARMLLMSAEMRKIVITNMLPDYEPSEGAQTAIALAKSSPKMQEMTGTMLVPPKDAPGWNLMGARAFGSGFAACQQCVAIVFHKLLQNSTFSSIIRLVHVTGHHFVAFGDFTGRPEQWDVYIVDLWLQNLHRPNIRSLADLGRDSADWPIAVNHLNRDKQRWYLDQVSDWKIDLEHDPLA